jgi:hypothetical protein
MILASALRSNFVTHDKPKVQISRRVTVPAATCLENESYVMIENFFDAVWVIVLGIVTSVVFKFLF